MYIFPLITSPAEGPEYLEHTALGLSFRDTINLKAGTAHLAAILLTALVLASKAEQLGSGKKHFYFVNWDAVLFGRHGCQCHQDGMNFRL